MECSQGVRLLKQQLRSGQVIRDVGTLLDRLKIRESGGPSYSLRRAAWACILQHLESALIHENSTNLRYAQKIKEVFRFTDEELEKGAIKVVLRIVKNIRPWANGQKTVHVERAIDFLKEVGVEPAVLSSPKWRRKTVQALRKASSVKDSIFTEYRPHFWARYVKDAMHKCFPEKSLFESRDLQKWGADMRQAAVKLGSLVEAQEIARSFQLGAVACRSFVKTMEFFLSNSQVKLPKVMKYSAFIALDWADQKHDGCILVKGQKSHFRLEHSPEAIDAWVRALKKRFPKGRIAVTLELKGGPLFAALLKYDFFDLYPVNPSTLAKYREAFAPSRAKNDPTDAGCMLDLLGKRPPVPRRARI